MTRPTGRHAARRAGGRAWLGLVLLLVSAAARGQAISNEWLSPRSRERARRSETRYIILHTTEGGSAGALEKLRRNGEAHYLVDEKGRIFRIVDRRRIAYHCGRSMWNGRTNLDHISIGIEIAGYHQRPPRTDQLDALARLLRELQRIYRIPDERVMPHSMVAYGAPNRWHSRNHRGRKRCGMLFARDDLRQRIGLRRRPQVDPDVRAGRLVAADPYLAQVLYAPARPVASVPSPEGAGNVITARRTAWDIARERYNSAETRYVFPDGTEKRGNEIRNWRALPEGTRVWATESGRWENEEAMPRVLGRDGATPGALAGEEWNRPDTVYLFADGRITTGETLSDADAQAMAAGVRIWIGYRIGGPVTARRRAFDICGPRWNAPDTFYLFPDGAITTGDRVEERRIADGTRILFRGNGASG